MGTRWLEPDPEDRRNGVDYRLSKEAIEREWLTGLFSSVGQEPAGSEALLLRMRERRTSALRKETPLRLSRPGTAG